MIFSDPDYLYQYWSSFEDYDIRCAVCENLLENCTCLDLLTLRRKRLWKNRQKKK